MEEAKNRLCLMREKTNLPSPSAYPEPEEDSVLFNSKNRNVLVAWLLEVSIEMNFSIDYIELTILLLDLYCSKKPVLREKAQLVGATCLFIAGKVAPTHKEEDSLNTADLAGWAKHCFMPYDIIEMESEVLNTLEFRLTRDTPVLFLDEYLSLVLPMVPERQTQELLVYELLLRTLTSLFCYTTRSKQTADEIAITILWDVVKTFILDCSDNSSFSMDHLDEETMENIKEYALMKVNRYNSLFNGNKKRKYSI